MIAYVFFWWWIGSLGNLWQDQTKPKLIHVVERETMHIHFGAYGRIRDAEAWGIDKALLLAEQHLRVFRWSIKFQVANTKEPVVDHPNRLNIFRDLSLKNSQRGRSAQHP